MTNRQRRANIAPSPVRAPAEDSARGIYGIETRCYGFTSGMPWADEIQWIGSAGHQLEPGLNEDELLAIEVSHSFRFPADLRAFLSTICPTGGRFPHWREPRSAALREQLGAPLEGIVFDIRHNVFWWPAWGERPRSDDEAVALAARHLRDAPVLIPVYGHRYLPAEPQLAGNPVFSVHQTDIVYYGSDLRAYLACEFGGLPYSAANAREPRRIPVWSEFI